jgi:energy-coupling factor transporter transmembrane protein EcfT
MLLAVLLALPLALLPPSEAAENLLGMTFGPTEESALRAGALVLRVLAASTLCCVLLLTTRWSLLLKAMRLLKAPAVLVSVVSLAFRYTVYFFRTAQEMFEAAESRRVGRLNAAAYRRHLGAQIGVLTGKTATMSDAVYLAMLSRGYRGEVRVIDDFTLTARDWLAMGISLAISAALFVIGR